MSAPWVRSGSPAPAPAPASAPAHALVPLFVLAAMLAGCGVAGCGFTARSGRVGSAARVSSTATATATVATTAAASTAVAAASGSPDAAAIARARSTHELPTPGGHVLVRGGWRTPTAAVSAFADTYVNWTAVTVAPRLRALAAASVGQARSELILEAGEVARDRELQAGGIANSGTVEAVAPVRGRARRYAVVTRESTRAARGEVYRGLMPEWHVSVATVVRRSDGLWVLSGWQPEN